MLSSDFLDDYQQISQAFFELVSSGVDAPPFVFGDGEGATAAATNQGVQWPVAQLGAEEEGVLECISQMQGDGT
jgi:hypothetical protein